MHGGGGVSIEPVDSGPFYDSCSTGQVSEASYSYLHLGNFPSLSTRGLYWPHLTLQLVG